MKLFWERALQNEHIDSENDTGFVSWRWHVEGIYLYRYPRKRGATWDNPHTKALGKETNTSMASQHQKADVPNHCSVLAASPASLWCSKPLKRAQVVGLLLVNAPFPMLSNSLNYFFIGPRLCELKTVGVASKNDVLQTLSTLILYIYIYIIYIYTLSVHTNKCGECTTCACREPKMFRHLVGSESRRFPISTTLNIYIYIYVYI